MWWGGRKGRFLNASSGPHLKEQEGKKKIKGEEEEETPPPQSQPTRVGHLSPRVDLCFR